MLSRRQSIGTLCALLLLALASLPVSAQSSQPSGYKLSCTAAAASPTQGACQLIVPADTIGVIFQLQFPSAQFSSVSNPEKADDAPSTAAFFRLEVEAQSDGQLLKLDYADLTATVSKTAPYALVSFDLRLVDTLNFLELDQDLTAFLLIGSESYTPASLSSGAADFVVELSNQPLVINASEGTGTTAPPTTTPPPTGTDTTPPGSTFTFSGNDSNSGGGSSGGGGGGGGLGFRRSSTTYCFDDPISSMTDDEWTIICNAKQRDIISGNPRDDGVFFFPNQAINRAEAAKLATFGILRSLGKLTRADFDTLEAEIADKSGQQNFITYQDINYEADGTAPWFAVFVEKATEQKIVHGYRGDNTYRAVNKINNAESYRIIGESGRIASEKLAELLKDTTRETRGQDWFLKYAKMLEERNIEFSTEYAKFTKRKDFVIMMMKLLATETL